MIGAFGWIGSILMALYGIPQAWLSFKNKNSHGISWGFLLMWAVGEVFVILYLSNKAEIDIPLLFNYSLNFLVVLTILYFKIFPKSEQINKI